jgi:hypothetical protein
MNMLDWHMCHVQAAAAQGWCLSEVAPMHTPHQIEIQFIQDAPEVGIMWDVQVPQLEDDSQAVQALQDAWMLGELHAQVAFDILKHESPSEFAFWSMHTWSRD